MATIIEKKDFKKKYKKVAYYPGCALEGSALPYDKSTRAIGKELGLELVDVKDWNCCGAMEVKNLDPEIETYLSSRVLSNAQHLNKMDVVMAPCNGCYKNLKQAEFELGHREKSQDVVDKISAKAGHESYKAGDVETIHALDWIKLGYGEEELRKKIKGGLRGLKIANYYGCMYTRPRNIFPEKAAGAGGDDLHKPHYMDDLLEIAGAENVDFSLKTACCGGAHTLSDRDMSTKLVLNILEAAEAAGAEVIATECPTCHAGLEMHQIRALKRLSKNTNVKIIYFTQLLGMAMGMSPRKVGLNGNISNSIKLMKEKGIA